MLNKNYLFAQKKCELWLSLLYSLFYIYVSPHFGGETYCFCPVRLSVTQFVSATPLKLQNRIS